MRSYEIPAMRGVILRARNARRFTPKSYPLSACNFFGRLCRPPRGVIDRVLRDGEAQAGRRPHKNPCAG